MGKKRDIKKDLEDYFYPKITDLERRLYDEGFSDFGIVKGLNKNNLDVSLDELTPIQTGKGKLFVMMDVLLYVTGLNFVNQELIDIYLDNHKSKDFTYLRNKTLQAITLAGINFDYKKAYKRNNKTIKVLEKYFKNKPNALITNEELYEHLDKFFYKRNRETNNNNDNLK